MRERLGLCRLIGVSTAATPGHRTPPGVDAVYSCPSPDGAGFIEAVRDVVQREAVNVVLPWTDLDALVLASAHKALADLGVGLVCPAAELVELACDKACCLAAVAALGVAVPATRVVHDGADLAAAAADLGYPRQKLVLKPRRLSGGRGMWIVRSDADLRATHPAPQLCLEALAMMLNQQSPTAAGDGFVVQQLIAGTDISVDVLAEQGQLAIAVARTRDATLGGLCVQGTVQPVRGRLRDALTTLVKGLSWSGLANVQLVIAEGHRPTVYEINARAAGSIGISTHAGVDLLSAAIRMALVGTIGERPEMVTVERTVAFRRHWHDQVWPTAPTAEVTA